MPRAAVRVLHAGHDDDRPVAARPQPGSVRGARSARPCPASCAAAPGTRTSSVGPLGGEHEASERRRGAATGGRRAEQRRDAGPRRAYGPVRRKEDARFLRGQGTFVDDIQLPGMLHGAILRSPLRPRPDRLDRHRRRGGPPAGQAVITGEMLAERRLAWMPTLSRDVQAVLATDKVRFQGQEVAFVVAEDRYSARDALELIDVEYEPLPVVVDAQTRAGPRRPGDPRRPGRPGGQPDLRLGGRRPGRHRRGVRGRGRRGHPGHALPAVASRAAGDLRRGGRRWTRSPASSRCGPPPRHRTRTAPCTRWWPGCPSTRSGSSPRTSAAGSATRSRSIRATCARSSAAS